MGRHFGAGEQVRHAVNAGHVVVRRSLHNRSNLRRSAVSDVSGAELFRRRSAQVGRSDDQRTERDADDQRL